MTDSDRNTTRRGDEAVDVVILGAGISGIGAARSLREAGFEAVLVEREPEVGGTARSFERDGFRYDLGPHFPTSGLAEELGLLEGCRKLPNFEAIRVDGTNYRYPLGLLKRPSFLATVGLAWLKGKLSGREPRTGSLEQYLHDVFGELFPDQVLIPLLEKWAGAGAAELSAAVATRLDRPRVRTLVHHVVVALTKTNRQLAEDGGQYWVYPEKGLGWLSREAARGLEVRTSCAATGLAIEKGFATRVDLEDGTSLTPRAVISTLPLDTLAGLAPAVRGELGGFRYRSLVLLYLPIESQRLSDHAWYWFPERECPFYRLSEMKVVGDEWGPPGETLLTAELACEEGDEVWEATPDELAKRCRPWIEELLPAARGRQRAAWTHRLSHAYPVFLAEYETRRRGLGHHTAVSNLFIAGRFGGFQYLLMEPSYRDGVECGKLVAEQLSGAGKRQAS